VAMYLARELTDQSLPAIGSAFGGRSHTTSCTPGGAPPRAWRRRRGVRRACSGCAGTSAARCRPAVLTDWRTVPGAPCARKPATSGASRGRAQLAQPRND
jgi:hypothetical protein